MSDDNLRSFFHGTPEDAERFKYEVIRGLSESVRQLAAGMADMQKTQVSMLERLAALEASKFALSIEALDARVDALMKDKDRRDGALGMLGTIKSWSPFIAAVLSAAVAFVIYGRMFGVVPAAPLGPVAPVRVEATGNPNDRRIEGVVGGTP